MKSVVHEYHTNMIHILRTSSDYEVILSQYISFLLEKIHTIENMRHEMIQEIDEGYIELLEKSILSSFPLVDISLDSRFKKMRRDMYQEFESAIAKVEFEIHQAMHIVETRRSLISHSMSNQSEK